MPVVSRPSGTTLWNRTRLPLELQMGKRPTCHCRARVVSSRTAAIEAVMPFPSPRLVARCAHRDPPAPKQVLRHEKKQGMMTLRKYGRRS